MLDLNGIEKAHFPLLRERERERERERDVAIVMHLLRRIYPLHFF